MSGSMNPCNGIQHVCKRRHNGVWDLETIRNVILKSLQRLKSTNRVSNHYDLLMQFIVNISKNEENWLTIVSFLMGNMPVDPYTMTAIVVIMRSIKGPDVATVTNLVRDRFHLCQQRATAATLNIETEKNICIVLNCLAEKFVGYQSTLVFCHDMCRYLCSIFVNSQSHNDPELQLRALLALEKYSILRENKRLIVDNLAVLNMSHLNDLENFFTNTPADKGIWRELRFCARWALDNVLPSLKRPPTYLNVDTSRVTVMFKSDNTNVFLKYSPDLTEMRNDTICPQTFHATTQVTSGVWYYEVTMVTNGSIIVGWGITGANMNKTVGHESFSVGYEGNKGIMRYNRNAYDVGLGAWKEGDVLGCLLNINHKFIIFYLNGNKAKVTSDEIFAPTVDLKNFFPAITISPFQQCVVNFGNKPFYNQLRKKQLSTFNTIGELTYQEKRHFGVPRLVAQVQEASYNSSEDACVICCDRLSDVTLLPCRHSILCRVCSLMVIVCPLCRADIDDRR